MKRTILWWLMMLLGLVLAIGLISNNEGYVLIIRSPYRIQFSFNFFLVLFVMSFFALHYGLRLLHFVRRIPTNRRAKREALRLKASNAALVEGIQALANGDIESAKNSVKLSQDLIPNPAVEKIIASLMTEQAKQGELFKGL